MKTDYVHQADAGEADVAPVTKIGIWKEGPAGTFVRDEQDRAQWGYWADLEVIPAKGSRKRVVLLGESVARGYFFDPFYTPAGVLAQYVEAAGAPAAEVLDLARTDLSLKDLERLCDECLGLGPDVVLIFAGNNWLIADEDISPEEFTRLVESFARGNFDAVKGMLQENLESAVVRLFNRLADIQATGLTRILFIIPEFNVLDWQSSREEKMITLHADEKTYDWFRLCAMAEAQLGWENYAEAARLARQMLRIDSSHPYPFELLARCKVQEEAFEEARALACQGKDTALFGRIIPKPRIYTAVREVVLQKAAGAGITVVDLSARFNDYLAGRLPGRQLFLDYCHLTDEGIRVAMAHVAVALVEGLYGQEARFEDLLADGPQPDDEVKSLAYFYAAIHNAHYGQAYDIIRHWCREAVQSSPVGAALMEKYADFASRTLSNPLCKTFGEFVKDEKAGNYLKTNAALQHRRDGKTMDITLVDAIVDSLREVDIHIEDHVRATRRAEHGVCGGAIDLLKSYYSLTSYNVFPGNQVPYYQSRHLTSEFYFIGAPECPLTLDVTYRIPGTFSRHVQFIVSVNGQVVSRLPASEKWTNKTICIAPGVVNEGVNVLSIHWPVRYKKPRPVETENIRNVGDLLHQVYHVYGEIFRLVATGDTPGTEWNDN